MIQFDRAKLKAVILYTCEKCQPSRLGAVKLHKVLYFSDMLRYAGEGSAITGATYRKRKLGPTCDQLLPTLRELETDGALEIRDADYFGYKKKEFIAKAAPDLERLNAAELALLDEVIEFVCENNSAKTISDYSHNAAWDMTDFGAVISYPSVFHLFPNQVSTEALDWSVAEVTKIEDLKSQGRALGNASYRAFRSRVLEKEHG
ncbi:Panacea domain-containing protein [Terrarubrum flagellatum]|uniref:Panacea domain-containing protein n=1 Tax=Terrirubrum flagellatum TaxID=2895980 RepID=UPI0031451857